MNYKNNCKRRIDLLPWELNGFFVSIARSIFRITKIIVPVVVIGLLISGCSGPTSSRQAEATAPRPSFIPDAAIPDTGSLLGAGLNLRTEPIKHIRFDHISIDDGLSQSVITSIYQDSQGFMWFGTQDGLNRYDGYEFKVYKQDPDDSHSLSANFILSIFEDREGTLWFGTNGGGLNRYDRETEQFTQYKNNPSDPNSLNSNFVAEIFEDHEGLFWVGTIGGGLELLDRETGRFTHFQNDPENSRSLGGNTVAAIFEDREGTLWIGTNSGGLNRWRHRGTKHGWGSIWHKTIDPVCADQFGAFGPENSKLHPGRYL